MKRKILLPTDFSENAWRAITFALELYKGDTVQFYLLNVFSATGNVMESLMNMEPGSSLFEIKKLDSENGLAKVLDKISLIPDKDQKHRFKTISSFNNTIEAMKNTVEKYDIETIVMGSKGESNAQETAFGSFAINAMEKIRNCPVMVVPKKAKLKMPKEIVFPTSFKTHYKRRELVYLIDIAKKCDATIAVLHVSNEDRLNETQKENKRLLKDIFEDTKHEFHFLSNNAITTVVNIFVESRRSDMVAFINKKHFLFGSMLTNPMVKQISFHLNVPIFALHDMRN